MFVLGRNIIFTFQLKDQVILKKHFQPREVWWWEGWSSVVPSRLWGLFNLQQIKVLDIVFIHCTGTWSLLARLTRVYLGYLSARQRYLLHLNFSCSRIFSLKVGNPLLCELARQLISLGAYEPWIQVCNSCKTLSSAKLDSTGPCGPSAVLAWPLQPDPLPGIRQQIIWILVQEKTIQSGSHYLADLNNERESKNETYKEVLAGLDNLVLVMWDDDTTIIPKVVALQIKIIHTLLILKSIRRSRHILVSMPWSRTQR